MLDYGYRSKCCKAPIKMGKKKIKKLNQEIKVWVCVRCKTKDCEIISKDEALRPEPPKEWWEDESDDAFNE